MHACKVAQIIDDISDDLEALTFELKRNVTETYDFDDEVEALHIDNIELQ